MITFSNSIYKREHESNPRGLGKWAFYVPIKIETLSKLDCPFEFYETNYGSRKFVLIWATSVMTLTDAKKELENWLKSKGLTNGTIFVAD